MYNIFNMSVLAKCLTDNFKSVFFVLGAPNAAINQQLSDFHSFNKNMKIVFCSDYYTMVDTERAKEGKPPIAEDIHGIPTNCRAHAEPAPPEDKEAFKDASLADKEAFKDASPADEEAFKDAQEATSEALVSMFLFSKDNNVPLYLASIPRDVRPLNVSVSDDKESDDLNVKNKLTLDILKSIVYPSYKREERSGKCEFVKKLKKHSKYGASYLIDLITVVMAMLGDDVWKEKKVDVSIETGTYKAHQFNGKPVTIWDKPITCVKYFKLEENKPGYWYEGSKEPISVQVFDFEKEGVMEQLKEKLVQVAKEIDKPRKHFKNSFVFGDDLLNDVDDIPAKYVVRRYTERMMSYYVNFSKIQATYLTLNF